MRILLLTLLGSLIFSAGSAQQDAPAQKVQRAVEPAPKEHRLEPGDAQQARNTRKGANVQAAPGNRTQSPSRRAAENVGKAQGPHLRMDHPTYNFGDVPRKGGDLVHDFVFTNDGTVPLVVTRVITSCSCLKASYSKRPVAPGESAAIRITYEPHKSEPGAFNKVIQIYSNSVDGRDVITVQGCSIPDLEHDVKVKGDKVKIK